FDHPAIGDVLAGEQVGDGRSGPGTVADRSACLAGKGSRRLAAAAAQVGVGPMLYDHRLDWRHLDNLATLIATIGRLVESRAAIVALLRAVIDDLVGLVGHLQRLALGAALLSPPTLGPARRLRLGSAFGGLALTFGRGVPRRRLAGVPRVLPDDPLELGDTGLQLPVRGPQVLDRPGLLHHERGQLIIGGRPLVWHIESPANSRANREYPDHTNALVTRDFENFLRRGAHGR